MTLYTVRRIYCDRADCPEAYEGFPGEPSHVVRRHALMEGWSRRDGDDFGPKHSLVKRRNPTPDQVEPAARWDPNVLEPSGV